jgi:serine/threonine-protein kinase RIO1
MSLQWTLASPWPHAFPESQVAEELKRLNLEDACEVYRIKHRSVFKTSLPPLGQVAVKEVRHRRLKQRYQYRQSGRSKAEREFTLAQQVYHKGLPTPIPCALGRDHDWLGLRRVIQIYEWLPAAETLTQCVRRGESPWEPVSALLWSCAQAGLVHGGHSSENLLRCEGKWYVIDLAEARLESAYEREGFARDVARICRKLIREQALAETEITPFVDAVVQRSGDPTLREEIPRAMQALLDQAHARRQK